MLSFYNSYRPPAAYSYSVCLPNRISPQKPLMPQTTEICCLPTGSTTNVITIFVLCNKQHLGTISYVIKANMDIFHYLLPNLLNHYLDQYNPPY